jgi:hypothetical protein
LSDVVSKISKKHDYSGLGRRGSKKSQTDAMDILEGMVGNDIVYMDELLDDGKDAP